MFESWTSQMQNYRSNILLLIAVIYDITSYLSVYKSSKSNSYDCTKLHETIPNSVICDQSCDLKQHQTNCEIFDNDFVEMKFHSVIGNELTDFKLNYIISQFDLKINKNFQ